MRSLIHGSHSARISTASLAARCLLVGLVGLVVALPAAAQGRIRVRPEGVYWGDAGKYTRPAALEAEKAFVAIPAYQEIQTRGLTPRDPDYWPLMRKAGSALRRALREICAAEGYDLVAERTEIQTDGETVPDITDRVVERLQPVTPRTPSRGPRPSSTT